MTTKWKIILTVVTIIVLGVLIWWFNQYEEEQQQINQQEELFTKYEGTSTQLHMDMDLNQFEKTENPEDIVLEPTEETEELLERWEAISEVFPEIEFPEEEIRQDNWIHVQDTLASNRLEMQEVSKKIGEAFADDHDESINSDSVANYIYRGSIQREHFREFLIEEGFEEESDQDETEAVHDE